MKQITKSKKGFSLTEIVLVVAIILILASSFAIGISEYLNTSQAAADQVDASVAALSDAIADKEDKLEGYGF
jgi:type IV pilus assembly protein PilA